MIAIQYDAPALRAIAFRIVSLRANNFRAAGHHPHIGLGRVRPSILVHNLEVCLVAMHEGCGEQFGLVQARAHRREPEEGADRWRLQFGFEGFAVTVASQLSHAQPLFDQAGFSDLRTEDYAVVAGPFAGIYSTYMLPDLLDKSKFAQNLAKAIKSVYASVYFSDSRSYIEATKNVIDEEKMAVVLQEVCGRKYGNRFYPTFSGVARSLNFYPVGDEKAETVNAGIEIRKEVCVERKKAWVKLEKPFMLKRGELVRVDLFISIPSARHFVVVDDAVPGGLEPVNRDLATASRFDAEKGNYKAAGGSFWFKYSDWREYNASLWSFYHRELRHDSVRFYSDYLLPGRYHLSYTAQAIAEGEFSMMPVHAEEMYDPDVFGKGLPGMMTID